MYNVYIIAGACLLLAQSILIIFLLANNSKRKRSEWQSRELNRHLIQTREEERKRIARELHDDFGQRIAFLRMDLEMGIQEDASLNFGGFPTRWRSVLAGLEELGLDIQQLSHRLHSSKLQYLGLIPALKNLSAQVEKRHGVKIDVQANDPVADVSRENELCVYRVAQEALHNIVKHSGADQAVIALSSNGSILRMEVSDNGRGFDQAEPLQGLGLASMRERLSIAGGDLQIRSSSGHGTVLSIHVPLAGPGKHAQSGN